MISTIYILLASHQIIGFAIVIYIFTQYDKLLRV